MTDILHNICELKRDHIAAQKQSVPESALLEMSKHAGAPRGFLRALQAKFDAGQYALICEIKKASPSGGTIRAIFDPEELARAYQRGGATCLSVLTDIPYFQGKDDDLRHARAAVSLPVLRKDFMLDPYQILESRALGADCVLLIMAALSDAQANELFTAATQLGMDVLVEVHNITELARAINLKARMIGINNRDLKTLKVDLATSESLAKNLSENILGVCESGIREHGDLKRMKAAGLSCFLVGESLMREKDVAQATKQLLGTV